MMNIKALLITFLLFFSLSGLAEVIDPNLTPTRTFICDAPIARTDGTPLAIDELAEIKMHVSTDGNTFTEILAGISPGDCKAVVDYTQVTDGDYIYALTAIDTGGRTSTNSQTVTVTVKRLAPPSPPSFV